MYSQSGDQGKKRRTPPRRARTRARAGRGRVRTGCPGRRQVLLEPAPAIALLSFVEVRGLRCWASGGVRGERRRRCRGPVARTRPVGRARAREPGRQKPALQGRGCSSRQSCCQSWHYTLKGNWSRSREKGRGDRQTGARLGYGARDEWSREAGREGQRARLWRVGRPLRRSCRVRPERRAPWGRLEPRR